MFYMLFVIVFYDLDTCKIDSLQEKETIFQKFVCTQSSTFLTQGGYPETFLFTGISFHIDDVMMNAVSTMIDKRLLHPLGTPMNYTGRCLPDVL